MEEDGRRTVLLQPGQPLEDAEDSTICTATSDNGSRPEQRVRDEILREPRRIEAEERSRVLPASVLPEDPWAERKLNRRRSFEAEKPSWSSIVKPILPKMLRTDEYSR